MYMNAYTHSHIHSPPTRPVLLTKEGNATQIAKMMRCGRGGRGRDDLGKVRQGRGEMPAAETSVDRRGRAS